MNVLLFAVTFLWFGMAFAAEYKGPVYGSRGVRVAVRRASCMGAPPSLLTFRVCVLRRGVPSLPCPVRIPSLSCS